MPLHTRFIVCFVLALLLAGCGTLKLGRKKSAEAKPAPQGGAMLLIGLVEMVNPEQHYVLIRCEQSVGLPAGTELIGLDASGSQSKLVLTPERKGMYLTADVKEGSPQVGNLVMQRKSGAALQPPAIPAAPPSPATSASMPGGSLTNPFPEPPPNPATALPLEPPLPKP